MRQSEDEGELEIVKPQCKMRRRKAHLIGVSSFRFCLAPLALVELFSEPLYDAQLRIDLVLHALLLPHQLVYPLLPLRHCPVQRVDFGLRETELRRKIGNIGLERLDGVDVALETLVEEVHLFLGSLESHDEVLAREPLEGLLHLFDGNLGSLHRWRHGRLHAGQAQAVQDRRRGDRISRIAGPRHGAPAACCPGHATATTTRGCRSPEGA